MRLRILLVSHSTLASGMADTARMIMGANIPLKAICAYFDPPMDALRIAKESQNSLDPDESLIILTDVFGGSVNTMLMPIMRENTRLIAGMNLALILSLLTQDPDMPLDQIIVNAINDARTGIVDCTKLDLLYSEESF